MHQLMIAAVCLALLCAVGCLVTPLVAFNGRRESEEQEPQ
jgi:hypothetical protein